MSNPYELIEVLGNGSFGVITKVKRRSDGLVKSLNPHVHSFWFEKMWILGKWAKRRNNSLSMKSIFSENSVILILSSIMIESLTDKKVQYPLLWVSALFWFIQCRILWRRFFYSKLNFIGDLAAVIKRCKREGYF